MNVFISDRQDVVDSEQQLFDTIQQGSDAQIFLINSGVNLVNYRFQSSGTTTSTWNDLDVSGTDLYNTLTSGQIKSIKLPVVSSPRVRLVGNAAGGSTLDFTITRVYNRPDGGSIPFLAY